MAPFTSFFPQTRVSEKAQAEGLAVQEAHICTVGKNRTVVRKIPPGCHKRLAVLLDPYSESGHRESAARPYGARPRGVAQRRFIRRGEKTV